VSHSWKNQARRAKVPFGSLTFAQGVWHAGFLGSQKASRPAGRLRKSSRSCENFKNRTSSSKTFTLAQPWTAQSVRGHPDPMPRAVRVDEWDRLVKAVGRLVTMLLPELILDRHGELVRAEVAGGNRHVRRKAEVG
jgi:hypothetical protein